VGPKKHSFNMYKLLPERRQKKESERKEMRENYANNFHMLLHLTHFLAFINATAGFFVFVFMCRRGTELNNKVETEKKITYFAFIIKLSCHIINFAK
jgi:hypothetical protein